MDTRERILPRLEFGTKTLNGQARLTFSRAAG